MSVKDLLTTTVLMPASDSLVSSNSLPVNKVAEELSKVSISKWDPDLKNIESAYIKVNSGSSQKIIMIQALSEFGMTRQNEQQQMGDYVVNLPGPITYSDVKITHVFTRDKFFLDWLNNGVNQAGVSRADIEIIINVKNDNKMCMVFTLYDAFPVKWEFAKWLTTEVGTGNAVDVVCENVTLTFSKVDFRLQQQK